MNIIEEASSIVEDSIKPLIDAYEELYGVPELPTARVFIECIPHFEDELYELLQETFTVGSAVVPQMLAPITPIFKDEFLGLAENGTPCYASDYWIAVDVPLHMFHHGAIMAQGTFQGEKEVVTFDGGKTWLQANCSHVASNENAIRVEYTCYPLREDIARLINS